MQLVMGKRFKALSTQSAQRCARFQHWRRGQRSLELEKSLQVWWCPWFKHSLIYLKDNFLPKYDERLKFHLGTWKNGYGGEFAKTVTWMSLPKWLSGKDYTCQYGRYKFHLWSGKISHASGQLSLCHNHWACALEPGNHNYWAHHLCNFRKAHTEWRPSIA